jgi:hypothetical protein
MASNDEKNELLVEVLTALAGICRKMAIHPAVPIKVREQASQLVQEFEELLPARGQGTPYEHLEGEQLITRMARFIPRVLDVEARAKGMD